MRRSRLKFLLLLLLLAGAFGGCLFLGLKEEGTSLCINEAMVSSYSMLLTGNEEQAEWIELYNGTGKSVCLEGYGLSNDPDFPFLWTFPAVTIESGEFLVVYAGDSSLPAESSGELSTNFRLNSRGGVLTLTASDGRTVDSFEYYTAYTNIPYGRSPDGGKPALLNEATPGRTNVTSPVSRYIAEGLVEERPVFSHTGGFYEEDFELTITSSEGSTVYYTLDGSEPDMSSARYEKPLHIQDPSSEMNRYANLQTAAQRDAMAAYGQTPVKKAVTVRARVFKNGHFARETECATYIFDPEPSLTTVSLVCDPEELFGFDEGIYVPGRIGAARVHTSFQTEANLTRYNKLGNYTLTGDEAARKAHIEVFPINSDKTISQTGEVRTSGGMGSAARADKPLRICATSKYGDAGVFEVPFFRHSETETEEFSELVLRAHEELVTGVLQDVFSGLVFLNDGLCVQAYEPVSVYINGEYWGVAALRERIDEKMIADHYGVDRDKIVLLKSAHEVSEQADIFADNVRMQEFLKTTRHANKMSIACGTEQDMEDYLALFDFAASHDLSDEANYKYLEERIDMDNFIRSQLAHIFFACRDWPDNNIRAFRTSERDDSSPYSDGKWRFVLYDMDFSCQDYEHNTLLFAVGRGEREYGWYGNEVPQEWAISLLRGLMDNREFREQFLNVYKEYRADKFQPQTLLAEFDALLEELGENIEEHSRRWTLEETAFGELLGVSEEALGPAEDSSAEIETMRRFFENRLSFMDKYMEEFYAEKGDIITWE